MSVGPYSEKFNIVSNNHGRTQKCDFCVLVCKTNFTDHHTPDPIHGLRDSVSVCKMHDCYCTIRKNIESISIPNECKRLQLDYMKSNHFKMLLNVFSTNIYLFKLYSISIILFLKNNLTNICSKINTCNMKSSGKYERWEEGGCTLYR